VAVETQAHERLRSAYLEMPGLCLTAKQAARLCALAEPVVASAISFLMQEGFLSRMAQGRYVRRGTCPACE
jgi:hypothetical protein